MGKIFNRYTRAQKKQLCKEWQASGLSQSEFCRQKELKIATFNAWLKKVKAIKSSNFIPLGLNGEEIKHDNTKDNFEIKINDKLVITVPLNADESLVLKIIKELNKCI